MANWDRLKRYFLAIPAHQGSTTLSFGHMEALVGSRLPPSSSKRWFWANTYHRYYAKFWLDAGWKVRTVAPSSVEFIRGASGRATCPEQAQPEHNGYRVERIPVNLTEQEFESMVGLRTDRKAIEIAKKRLMSQFGSGIRIEEVRGADLHVLIPGGTELDIEVKGTEKSDIAWSQLKVSSQASHDKLTTGVPMWRVTGVGTRTPLITVLVYGQDFTLETEPRWCVKPVHRKRR